VVVGKRAEVRSRGFGSIGGDEFWFTFSIDIPGRARPHHQMMGSVNSCEYTLLAPDAKLMREIESTAKKMALELEAHEAWLTQKEQPGEQAQEQAGTTPTQTETATGLSQPSSVEESLSPR